MNEKIRLAFCIYLSECTRVYDEETNEEKNGIVLFKSVERIEQEFENYKSLNPGMFDITVDNSRNEEKKDFGYSKNNPVLTVSVGDSYNYLSRLVCDGGMVTYSRMGSCGVDNGHILDIYKVTVIKRTLFLNKRKEFILYMDSYADTTSAKAPKPFRLK